MGLFYDVYCFVFFTIIDYFIFAAIDFVAKTALRDSRSDAEKRQVWLYEALILLVVGTFIYLISHTPYILFFVSIATILYSIIHGRVYLHDWLLHLENRWDEFQQHEESMEISRSINQTPTFSASVPLDVPTMANRYPGVSPRRPLRPEFSTLPQPSSQIPVQLRKKTRWGPSLDAPKNNVESLPSVYSVPALSVPTYNQPYVSKSVGSFASKLRSAFSFLSALNRPPGLKNNGENLCFMNAILQCLAHSPSFASLLTKTGAKPGSSDVQQKLLSSCTELIQQLSCDPKINMCREADNSNFRFVVSNYGCPLVTSDETKQCQQDAAEFLMWLLEALHTSMDLSDVTGSGNESGVVSPTLAMLGFIYGDLTGPKIEALKRACLREIEMANGLDNESHAEPMQRLSDLEWLHYKQRNKSVIDDLCTGQLVESQNCLNCNRVSVGIQTFRILPLPIVSPHRQSGIVHVEDCLGKFGHIEVLFGEDGLKCPCSNLDVHRIEPGSEKLAKTPISYVRKSFPTRRAPLDSAMSTLASPLGLPQPNLMSPILSSAVEGCSNDSGFQDQMRTSTPVRSAVGQQIAHCKPNAILTNGQQRSLLRQLPDCLIVQLMRFQYKAESSDVRKVRTPVNIPLKNLDMKSMVFDTVINREDLTAANDGYVYDLYAVCVHLGAESTSCGHYIAFCQTMGGIWYKFDDENVSQVNMDFELNTRLIRENSYILFYRRRKSSQSS